jgi:hypothetical protein
MDPLLRDVVTLLAFCGLTLVITRGFIAKGFRDLFDPDEREDALQMSDRKRRALQLAYEFVRCPLCAGAWLGAVGWILRCWILYPLGIEHFAEALIVGLTTALISAAVGGTDARG